jgi:hypothetical protein
MAMESIPHTQCMPCLEGAAEHHDWHPTRGALLKIGKEMTARVRAREDRTVAQMPDDELVAYGIRMRRLLAQAADDAWPDFLVALVAEWVQGAEKEWRWRRRAASLGADSVVRSGGSWPDRVEAVKRQVDLLALIGFETGGMRMHGRDKFSCRCPFHDDRDPSLDVDVEKGVWLCRVCQVGGDAIRYAELKYGYSFVEAVRHLEERAGIRPPEREIHGVQIIRADGGR